MRSQFRPRRGRPAARLRLRAEPLEDRRTPAVAVWVGGGTTDDWSDPANWCVEGKDAVPSFLDDAVFDGTSSNTVRISQETLVASVTVDAGYTGTITLAGTALVVTGDLTIAAGTFAHAGSFLGVGGNVTVTGGTLSYSGTDLVVTGNWTVAPGAVFDHATGAPVTFNRDGGPQVLDSGGADADHDFAAVRQLGTGALQLAGHDLAVTGALEVEGGMVDDAFVGGTFDAAGRAVTVGGPLTIRNNSTYQGGTVAQTFGGLLLDVGTVSGGDLVIAGDVTAGAESAGTSTLAGTVRFGGTRAVTVADADDELIVTAATGNGGVVKRGAGVLRLDGASPDAGPTTVEAGSLIVGGALGGPVALAGGTLGGTGTVGPLSATGGTLAPGAGGTGVLATGGVTLSAAATVAIELGGGTAGQFDQLGVTGAAALGGATLIVAPVSGFVPAAGDRFAIVQNDGADPVQGTFAGLPEGATLTVGGRTFQITYVGGDGNDVELVPPPTIPPTVPPTIPPTVPPTVPPIVPPAEPTPFAVGADRGGARVEFFNADGSNRFSADVFSDFTGGVRTAVADFTGDGVADLVVGSGPGMATQVRVFDGASQAEVFGVAPFEVSFTGGVYVAAGDLNGDGVPELVIAPDAGGGPRCRVFDGRDFSQLADFFGIEDSNFRGGARAAIGDVNGDGVGDLVVAAGFGGGPRVAGYDGRTVRFGITPERVFGDFFVFEQTLRNGVFIAAGDVDGDGFAEVIAGGGPGGGPRVFALSGKALVEGNREVQIANFFGGDEASRGGIRVAVKDLDGDTRADLVVGAGEGAGSRVTAYAGKDIPPAGGPRELRSFDAFPGFTGGVFVG